MSKLKYDCMSIKGNGRCENLYDSKKKRVGGSPRLFICKTMHIVLHPEISNQGKLTEKFLGVSPDFNCPVMQELREKTGEPKFTETITKNQTESWNTIK